MKDFPYKSGYLPEEEFKPHADKDGASAAAWLISKGVRAVTHADKGPNGLATGHIDGVTISLSTTGYLTVLD